MRLDPVDHDTWISINKQGSHPGDVNPLDNTQLQPQQRWRGHLLFVEKEVDTREKRSFTLVIETNENEYKINYGDF